MGILLYVYIYNNMLSLCIGQPGRKVEDDYNRGSSYLAQCPGIPQSSSGMPGQRRTHTHKHKHTNTQTHKHTNTEDSKQQTVVCSKPTTLYTGCSAAHGRQTPWASSWWTLFNIYQIKSQMFPSGVGRDTKTRFLMNVYFLSVTARRLNMQLYANKFLISTEWLISEWGTHNLFLLPPCGHKQIYN